MKQFELICAILRPLDKVIRFVTGNTWFITVDGCEIDYEGR